MPSVNDDGWLTAGPTDPDEVRAFYDEWSHRYDDDLAGWDYRAPARIAGQLAAHGDLSASVLDAGCGTGLSGRALRAAGFRGEITGIDLSEASLPIALGSGAYTAVRAASRSTTTRQSRSTQVSSRWVNATTPPATVTRQNSRQHASTSGT